MIFPLSSRGGDLVRFPNFVQLNTSTVSLVEEMADWIVANDTQAHLINIIPDGGGRTGEESRLTDLVRTRLQANGMEGMTICQWRPQMHLDSLRKIMRPGVENMILFPTINEAAASRTLPDVVCTGRSIPDHGNWFPRLVEIYFYRRGSVV